MVTDVGNILNGSQQARLLAITQTARQMDDTSLRLASGLKVNSALDDPSNFFAARSLKYRAQDLSRLLDGIGQNIRAVQLADEGVSAGLQLLDNAEAYLTDIEKKYQAGEIDTELIVDPSAPTNETYVTFNGPSDLIQYVSGQDTAGTAGITTTTDEVTFSGNYWKRKAFNYTVTADTVLVFEFRSTLQPEVAAIGFDNDTNFNNDNDRFFIHGSQTSGVNYSAPVNTFRYTTPGAWQTIEIPIGLYFTGTYSHLHFIHDDDAAPLGNASYRNITLREGPVQVPGMIPQASSALSRGYEKITDQLDLLANDANYRGINLLKNETMTTYFNPQNTAYLVTEGIDATVAGLGLETRDFNSIEAVQDKLIQVREARKKLRSFGMTLANDLNIIQTRHALTSSQIVTAHAGANDLIIADANEEGANMIALQTRQQIQMGLLSLAPASILMALA